MFALTEEQQDAVDGIISSDGVMALIGAAGTGKSFTVETIINELNKTLEGVTITATTNKAVEILRESTGMSNVLTVHKALGFRMQYKNYEQVLTLANKDRKIERNLIIDEMSMIPDEIWKNIEDRLKDGELDRVILVGDMIQLPPINSSIDILSKADEVFELTEQLRQSSNIDREVAMYELRRYIEWDLKDFPFEMFTPDMNIFMISDHKEFTNLYKANSKSSRVLSYYNNNVEKTNENIMSRAGDMKFMAGDKVIMSKPVGRIMNNETVTVVSSDKDIVQRLYKIKVINKRGIESNVINFFTPKIETDFYEAYKMEVSADEYISMHEKTVRLKHIYASTVHKSQGDTYDNVFVDGSDIMSAYNKSKINNKYAKGISYNMFLRLMYVGISRMKENAYVFIGSKRKYSNFKD